MVRSRITGSKWHMFTLKVKFFKIDNCFTELLYFRHTTRFSHVCPVPPPEPPSPSHPSLSQSPCLRVKFLTEMVRLPSKLFKERLYHVILSAYIQSGAERGNAERMQEGLLPSSELPSMLCI